MGTNDGRELSGLLAGLTPSGWRFDGLENWGGGSYNYTYREVGGSGVLLVSGEDTLSGAGDSSDFGGWVFVGQATDTNDDGLGEFVRSHGSELARDWVLVDDDEVLVSCAGDVAGVVRSVFAMWFV